MPRRKRDAGASPPTAGTPVELTIAQILEWIVARTDMLAKRATAAGFHETTSGRIRRHGREACLAVRRFAEAERHLNAVQTHVDALTELGRDGPAGASSSAAAARSLPRLHRITSIQAQLRLLRARQNGDDALEAEKQAIHFESGLGIRRISALLAHTNGGLKAAFARRALRSVSGDARKQLAEELSGYGYGTVAQLLKGVGR